MSMTKRILIPCIVLLVVFAQLALPGMARADDEQPPQAAGTEAPADPGGGSGDEAGEPAAPPETPTVPEILEQVPPDTGIAVVNDEGELEPLASQQAAEIIVNSDPVWCPAGQTPATDTDPATPGNQNGCTSNQASVTDLLIVLQGDPVTYSGDGTIFFEDGVYGGSETSLVFDNSDLTGLGSLTLQGGWDLVNYVDLGGSTTFNAPVVINWASNVTLNNVAVENSTGAGLVVVADGNIQLNDVSASGNDNTGAFLVGGGDVSVDGGDFSGNDGYGLYVYSDGAINLNDVVANDNSFDGADLVNYEGTGNVTVTNGQFDGNGGDGLFVDTSGNVTIDTVQASGNGDTGLEVYSSGGDISLTNVVAGYDEVNELEAGNAYGAYLQTSGTGEISVVDSDFVFNAVNGLVAVNESGSITLEGVVAAANGTPTLTSTAGFFGLGCTPLEFEGGVWLVSDTGDIIVLESDFDLNEGDGLVAQTGGSIGLENSGADGNTSNGAVLQSGGQVVVVDSVFEENGSVGLEVAAAGDILLEGVEASGNGFAGAWLKSYEGDISVVDSLFANNGSYGLKVFGQSLADLENVTATGNGTGGIYIDYLAPCGQPGGIDVTITGGLIENNGAFGIYANLGPDGSLDDDTSPPSYGAGNGPDNPTNPTNLIEVYTIHACPPPDKPKPPEPPAKPYNKVEVPDEGGQPVLQDCEVYAGLIMTLPNGDGFQVACPAEGSFTVQHVPQEELPGDLPLGPRFVSALTIEGTDAEGQPVKVLEDGHFLVSFAIPEGMERSHFSILYWDESANDGSGGWVELPLDRLGLGTVPLHRDAPEDGMLILRGVRQEGGEVTVKVNFTGTFVLVAR